jgi:hypothetical protein
VHTFPAPMHCPCELLEPIGCTVLRRRTSCASLFCREHCDAFRFATGRSLAHPHRTIRSDSIDTLDLSIVCCKVFYLERFDALRCASMFFAALQCFSLRSGPHFLHTLACEHCTFNPLRKLLNPPQLYPAKAACHHRRDSVDACSGLPTFRVTIIVKSRTPRALTPRSSSV